MLLIELYQEQKGSSFTHDGVKYDLNKLLKRVDNKEVTDYDVSELKWVLKDTKVKAERVTKADLSKPILVTKWHKKLVAVDGAHRLTKAVQQKVKQLPGKYVTKEDLKAVEIEE